MHLGLDLTDLGVREELDGCGSGAGESEPEREPEEIPQVEKATLRFEVLALDEAIHQPRLAPHVVARLDGDDLRLGVLEPGHLGVERIDEGLCDVQHDVDRLVADQRVVAHARSRGGSGSRAHGLPVVQAHELDRLDAAFLTAPGEPRVGVIAQRLVALLGGLAVPDAVAGGVDHVSFRREGLCMGVPDPSAPAGQVNAAACRRTALERASASGWWGQR